MRSSMLQPCKGRPKALWLHGAPARGLKIDMQTTLKRTLSTALRSFQSTNSMILFVPETYKIPVLQTKSVTEDGSVDFNQTCK